ncbi:MAG: acetyl-CoA carboxylase biotin carboxyl carrier protein subunit [Burkholderiales bacterium]|nr:acetyl-CoA carboxylase biotin carboxyl carrier protein subunit [Burkholderiales bacterium]
MDAQQVKAFIDAMAASDLAELEVSHEGWTLRLVRHSGTLAVPAAPAVIPATAGIQGVQQVPSKALDFRRSLPSAKAGGGNDETVSSPMFGVLHLQPAPGEPPFVKPGDAIEAGRMLCTIEAMKVFNEVRAERAGRVVAVLAAPGAEVEAGQPLFTIERAADV